MKTLATLQVQFVFESHPDGDLPARSKVLCSVPLRCPFCGASGDSITTWGYYATQSEERRRFRCECCHKTFNAAKLPIWQEMIGTALWRIVQHCIRDNLPVISLAKTLEVPTSTLRELVNRLKDALAQNAAYLQQIQSQLGTHQSRGKYEYNKDLRAIFVDEGFLKIEGMTCYVLFVVDAHGTPVQLYLSFQRTAQHWYEVLEQAIGTVGWIDVIVSDGAAAIHRAVLALHRPIWHIRHIHSGSRQRVLCHEVCPTSGKKSVQVRTVELHSSTSLPHSESLVIYSEQERYVPQTQRQPRTNVLQRPSRRSIQPHTSKRTGIYTPEETIHSHRTRPASSPHLLKGAKYVVLTGASLNDITVIPVESCGLALSTTIDPSCHIQSLITVLQSLFPRMTVTSNVAEVFNSVHDNVMSYRGRKALIHAQRDAAAWLVSKYCPDATKTFLERHHWSIPLTLLQQCFHLLFSDIKIR